MKKKILILFFLMLSIFYEKTYAIEENDNKETQNIIESYSVEITINDNNSITIDENFKTGKINSDISFGKHFYNHIYYIQSNFFELPNNSQIIDAKQYNPEVHYFLLESNTSYHLKYKLDIITSNKGKMNFTYNPVFAKNADTNYKHIYFKINYDDKYMINDIESLEKISYFNVTKEENTIKGTRENIIFKYDSNEKIDPTISFSVNKGLSQFEFYLLGIKTNYLYLIISIFFFLLISLISFFRIKNKDMELNDKTLILLLIYAFFTLFFTYKMIYSPHISELIILSVLFGIYGIAIKSVFFQKSLNEPTSLIAKIFILFHAYFMISAFNISNDSLSFSNIYLILLLTSIEIASYAYSYDELKKEYTLEDMISIVKYKPHKLKPYSNFKEFAEKYLIEKRYNYTEKAFVFFPVSIIVLFPLVMNLVSFLNVSYEDEGKVIFFIVYFLFILCSSYIFIYKPKQKYDREKKLIKEGQIYNNLEFTYIKPSYDKESGFVKYRMKVKFNYLDKEYFISDKKKEYYLYDNKTCSIIILSSYNYYIDLDIPKR